MHQRTNILDPRHFIVEEENEALLSKELQEAKIHSAHDSHSSMHSSQPHLCNFETEDFCLRNPHVSNRGHRRNGSNNMHAVVRLLLLLVIDRACCLTFQIVIVLIDVNGGRRETLTEEPIGNSPNAFHDRYVDEQRRCRVLGPSTNARLLI